MSISREQMIDLLNSQLESTRMGSGIVGKGKRRTAASYRPPTRRRARGRGEYEMEEEYEGSGAMIGGRKKRMSAATKAYLAEYRRTHAPRKARGRGAMIGGSTPKDYFEEYLGRTGQVPNIEDLQYFKAGIAPMSDKDTIIAKIHGKERRIYGAVTPKSKLDEYSLRGLLNIDGILDDRAMRLLTWPPPEEYRDRTRGRNDPYVPFKEDNAARQARYDAALK